MSFDWKQRTECLAARLPGHLPRGTGPCEADRAAMIAEGERLEHGVASLVETLKTIESLECHACEAQEIAGGALAYAPHHTEHGLMVRNLQAENARLGAHNAALQDERDHLRSRNQTYSGQLVSAFHEKSAFLEENARLREALVTLVISGEWLAFGNLPESSVEPMPIAEALNHAHAALEEVKL